MKKAFRHMTVGLLTLVLLMVTIVPAQAAATPLPYRAQGGRHDIELPGHANTIKLRVHLDSNTRIMFFDSSYREIGAGNWGPTGLYGTGVLWDAYDFHVIDCGPKVKYVAFFLHNNNKMWVKRYP